MSDENKVNPLHEEATKLGISFHPAIGDVKLQEKIDTYKKENPSADETAIPTAESTGEAPTPPENDPIIPDEIEDKSAEVLQAEADKEQAEADEAEAKAQKEKEEADEKQKAADDAKLNEANNEIAELKRQLAEKTDVTPAPSPKPAPNSPEGKSAKQALAQKHLKKRNDSLKLVRVNITCMNPNKRQWKGELFSVGNRVIGTVKKFVMFNTPEGFHVPAVLLNMIKARECQIFVEVTLPNGKKTKKGTLIPEFSIQELDALTEKELEDLSKRQALSGAIDQEV